ncbi:MAG TPA: type IV toxin-antitoxin system AbiEi family antitoxin [Kamptonema sp.]|nr:type IV toxin-antitoxin system AbiEi family antitoxin [Kamptonema sp.]
MKIPNLEQQAFAALRACLQEIPFVQVELLEKESEKEQKSPEFQATLKLPTHDVPLVVDVKPNGQPLQARSSANKLFRSAGAIPGAYGVFIAPYISPKSAEICTQEDIGYVDLAGNCRLCFGQVYIQKEGKPNPFNEKRDLRSLYSPKAERVLRVLLNSGQKAWKVQDLGVEAAVSLGQVSNVKKLLTDRELIKTGPDGFWLGEPCLLLSDFRQHYDYRRHQVFNFYSLKSVGEMEAALAQTCSDAGIRYALTGFSGAARYAPVVRYQRVMAYVAKGVEKLAEKLNLKAVNSGANVSLLQPYDEGVFYQAQDIDGTQVVSPIQLYLDLYQMRGRGEEAAQALLEQVIMPQW